MNILKKTALFSSFFVFNFISTTYPVDKIIFPKAFKHLLRLETKVNAYDKMILGTKKQSILAEEVKIGAKKKIYIDNGSGLATYYADAFHGRKTSSGEIFDMNNFTTAASYNYAIGTILKVTNTTNGNTVEVKVNDRGAFSAYGVTLDLSKAAFSELAPLSRGVIWVKIEIVQ